MPKSSFIMAYLTGDTANRRKANETWVYKSDCSFALHRVGNDVYRDGERGYYIEGDAVCDADGVRQFYIDGVWWYTYDGVAAYYQNRAIPDWKGDECPDDLPLI